MSYDLMVFDPAAVPLERPGFIAWVRRMIRMGEGSVLEETQLEALTLWRNDMAARYRRHSLRYGREVTPTLLLPDFRITASAIYASFDWRLCVPLYRDGLRLAQDHQIGFFDVSGEEAAVWIPGLRGRLAVVHKSERGSLPDGFAVTVSERAATTTR